MFQNVDNDPRKSWRVPGGQKAQCFSRCLESVIAASELEWQFTDIVILLILSIFKEIV